MLRRKRKVKKSIIMILIAILILGLSVGCTSPEETNNGNEKGAQGDVNEVRIGVILPLSGPLSAVGTEIKQGTDFAAEMINEEGGIESLGGAKVKLIYADSQSVPEVGMSEAERLILRENVSALAGAFQSSVTYTSTEVAEKHKVPYQCIIAADDSITQRGFEYTFKAMASTNKDSELRIQFLDEMSKRTGVKVNNIALVYENTEWGQSAASNMREWAEVYGIDIVLDEAYPHNTSDLMPVVRKIAAAKPDSVYLAAYLSDAILLAKGVADLEIDFICAFGSGVEHSNPGFYDAVGDIADYRVWLSPWHVKMLDAPDKEWAKPINEAYKEKYGLDMSAYVGCAFSDIYILKEAIEEAASANPQEIQKALREIKITSGPAMIRPTGDMIYFDENGDNPNAISPLIQTVKLVDYIIWPPELATPDFDALWPMPSWEERKAH